MLIDAGFEGTLAEIAEVAAKVETTGRFSALWISDTGNDPFLLCALGMGELHQRFSRESTTAC